MAAVGSSQPISLPDNWHLPSTWIIWLGFLLGGSDVGTIVAQVATPATRSLLTSLSVLFVSFGLVLQTHGH